MELNTEKKSSLRRVVDTIATLDLESVKRRLMHERGEYRWSAERAERAEEGYRRYLTLRAKYPGVQMSPTLDIDTFWHAHILDTRKYAEDCDAVFGGLLHHVPSLGDEELDEAQHEQASWVMSTLYEREFGEPLDLGPAEPAPAAGNARTALAAKMAWCM
jgi:hypothetical protein